MAGTITVTKLFNVDDCKIFPITKDDSTGITYGAGVDIPGIRAFSQEPKFIEKELQGDARILDTYSKLQSIDWSMEHAKVSLDALAVMLGGAVDGTSGAYELQDTNMPSYFGIEVQVVYSDGGDFHLQLHKAKCNKVKYDIKGDDYAIVTASGSAIPTTYVPAGATGGITMQAKINATATAISTTWTPLKAHGA